MTETARLVDVAIVVEWEHVSLGAGGRATRMLREVKAQTLESGRPAELILVYDSNTTEPSDIDELLDREGMRGLDGLDVRTEGAPGLRYYEMKNFGTACARAPIVVLLDSDVIPLPGWLNELVAPFEDPAVQVVPGNVYIDPRTTYDKAFALFWLFRHLDRSDSPSEMRWYHANHVAYRRDVFLEHPWPVGTTLSPNMVQGQLLSQHGIPVTPAPASRALHPTPGSLTDMARYAFSSGYDRVYPRSGKSLLRRALWLLSAPVGLAIDVARSTGSILPRARRRAVGLSLPEVPVAIAIAMFYALLKSIGHVITVIAPDYIPRRWATGSSLAGSQARPEHLVAASTS